MPSEPTPPIPFLPPFFPFPFLSSSHPLSPLPRSPSFPPSATAARAQTYRVSSNPALAELKLAHLNRFFRSLTVAYNESEEWWEPDLSVDWRWDDRLKPVLGLRTEGACKASWAITAVTATEMAYAIVASAFPALPCAARVSVQQVLDCEPSNSSCTGGGWPTSALDYMVDATQANGGLATETAYPYTQKQGVCNATRSKKLLRESTPKAIGVIGYDQVDFFGWLGLTLAVQTQPTIAFVRGSHPTFLSYRKGTYEDRACAGGVVDHSVVVVGYEMDNYDTLPYWIVRNSWGPTWGEKGYMRMAMIGGIGICGIHSVPAIYPVIKTPSPCNDQINPCGWGDCAASTDPSGPPYVCSCADGFVPVTNNDGTPTCALDDVCSWFEGGNPCGVGSCLSDSAGGYLCLCPPGFKRGQRAGGTELCVPTAERPRNISYPMDVDCELVYQIYGLDEEQFLAQNPNLENDEGWCDTIWANTVVNVTLPPSAVICGLFYSWSPNDTCADVASGFNLTVSDLQDLNPGVNCSVKTKLPAANQQVCVQEGDGADFPMCTQFYTVLPSNSCDSIMARFKLSQLSFYALNPGLSCAALFPYLSGPDENGGDQQGGDTLSGTQTALSPPLSPPPHLSSPPHLSPPSPLSHPPHLSLLPHLSHPPLYSPPLPLFIPCQIASPPPGYACSAVPSFALLQPRHLNRVSRYASMGYDGGCDCWSVDLNVDWRDLGGVQGVRNEGACKASWAITAVNAVELTMGMIADQLPSYDSAFNISVQQVVDCEPSSSSCKGGWPTSALDYMVDASNDLGGVVPEVQYPYKGKQAKCNAGKIATSSTPLGLARYEQVDYYGWIGLLLAVQVQPVIAFVRGSYPSFQKYKSGVYDDPKCAAAGIVDHAVVVVGYEFTGSDGAGNWIVRNSWGTKWGEQGHMRMAFAGSVGICGIHSVPALYPIIQVPSPCDSPQKPCGGGVCVPEDGGYSCQCPAGFVSYTNDDGTATCAPLDACGTQASNPCLTGTCINDNAGGYFCLCPPGYAKGSLTLGWETCTPSTDPPTTLTFPVDVDCPRVYQLYGLSEDDFLAQNSALSSPCVTIPANTEINVAPTSTCINCSLFYSWTSDDSCSAVAGLFGIDETELTRLNPGLDCSGSGSCQAPSPGQQVGSPRRLSPSSLHATGQGAMSESILF
ncbi:unnamed protein product, partial [Closterium sp. Naga37s-1]